MGKIKNLLAIIGAVAALNSCSQPNKENQKIKQENQRNSRIRKEGCILLRYYFSFEGKNIEMNINEKNFIENYNPDNTREDEEMLIDTLFYQFGTSPLPEYNPNLSLEDKWNALEIEKKRAFYKRFVELRNP